MKMIKYLIYLFINFVSPLIIWPSQLTGREASNIYLSLFLCAAGERWGNEAVERRSCHERHGGECGPDRPLPVGLSAGPRRRDCEHSLPQSALHLLLRQRGVFRLFKAFTVCCCCSFWMMFHLLLIILLNDGSWVITVNLAEWWFICCW